MKSDFYLPRTLFCKDKKYNESELLDRYQYIVVLAEPGGGKTSLLESLAQRLEVSCVTASRFRHGKNRSENCPLVIDAFDELSKLDRQGIDTLLAKAEEVNPSHLIISSRSSEWNYSATSIFQEYFHEELLIVRLQEFVEGEQQEIFENYMPSENFPIFQAEVSRFDLDALLPNPQFLKLFADAYIESGRTFTDKRSIFSQAIERLAKEVNPKVRSGNGSISTERKVEVASEIFAKLLLSGTEGVTTTEAMEAKLYPVFTSLIDNTTSINEILATRLFKPGDTEDTHRPVHRIVAEFAAADYLTKRIIDPTDTVELNKLLPIIAPNSVVRDELRGLLGWMASLGHKCIQEAVIELDAYAVLANGDPSQLESSSKRLLIRKLKEVEDKDPYFRREDFWRRFSIAGFFTPDVVNEIKPLLTEHSQGHLRELVLELLMGSPAIEFLIGELCDFVLSSSESESTRLLANSCLLDQGVVSDSHVDLAGLIFEASSVSLNIAAKTIEKIGPDEFDREYLAGFFRVCANLYSENKNTLDGVSSARDSMILLIERLELETLEYILDKLTDEMACLCGEDFYSCRCLNGISNIVGLMLDRYFETFLGSYDPEKIWTWIRSLNFNRDYGLGRNKAAEMFRVNTELRQGILKYALGNLTGMDEIFEMKSHINVGVLYSGLEVQEIDHSFIVDFSFDTGNSELWRSFVPSHIICDYGANKFLNLLRRSMRRQARESPVFMVEWAKVNRALEQHNKKSRIKNHKISRKSSSREEQKNKNIKNNIKFLRDNRKVVESGCHWGSLVCFSIAILNDPGDIKHKFENELVVINALLNCIDFIAPSIPGLGELSKFKCKSKEYQSMVILYAACLCILRKDGHLEKIPINLLVSLKTSLYQPYAAVGDDERGKLNSEVNRLAFLFPCDVEVFCRDILNHKLWM